MVLAKSGKVLSHFTGSVEGRMLTSLSGVQGFGYDPLFVPEGYDKTFAELGNEIKNSLSHRARALSAVMKWLNSHSVTEN